MKAHLRTFALAFCALLLTTICALAAPSAKVAAPFVFTDQSATIQLENAPPDDTKISYSLATITRDGWGPQQTGEATLRDGALLVSPLVEGIHIVRLRGATRGEAPLEARFLAVAPPPAFGPSQRAALARNLPNRGDKLLRGEPFEIVGLGDSVTATGDYPQLLAMLLARATGNRQIRAAKRGHAGRSIDATVRHWPEDMRDLQPDLGLLMYGLNEQITFYPIDAYQEQYRWVAARLKTEFGADTVFLEPTPDYNIALDEAARAKNNNPPQFALRTIAFAAALRQTAREADVALAPTFDALWPGGVTLQSAARRAWPLYPTSYGKPLTSLLETDGRGDTIHPNALGHLQIARAVLQTLVATNAPPPLRLRARTRWTSAGVVSRVSVTNDAGARRAGRLEVYPQLEGELNAPPLIYDLAPGQSVFFDVAWPQAPDAAALMRFPNSRYLAMGRPVVPVVDVAEGSSRVYGVDAPFEVDARFERTRQIVAPNQKFDVGLWIGQQRQTRSFVLPRQNSVGAIPLLERVERGGKVGWAAGELRYTRFGAASPGEAQVDGDLTEWAGAPTALLGEPSQARYARGPEDYRGALSDAYLRWSFRAGESGLYLAARGQGELVGDNFTLFFDPRAPDELGTPGRYYWASGKLMPDRTVQLKRGETSAAAPTLRGAWRPTKSGLDLELFVPYALMERASWPQSGDLGFSLWWVHAPAEGKKTNLLWSDEGHPWNPRWYGVVRRTDDAQNLPFMVRVR